MDISSRMLSKFRPKILSLEYSDKLVNRHLFSENLFLADNGSMYFWDWKTGYNFQRTQAAVQPGSLDSEAGIFSMTFDMSGSRLITTEADKTIKIYKEDDTAVSFSFLPSSDISDWEFVIRNNLPKALFVLSEYGIRNVCKDISEDHCFTVLWEFKCNHMLKASLLAKSFKHLKIGP